MKILYIPTFNKTTEIDSFFQKNKSETFFEKNPDIIFVSGGDGSLLHAIQEYQHLNVPFFGIANGTKNFLMNEVSVKDLHDKKFYRFETIETPTIKIKVKRRRSNGTKYNIFKAIATNDVVFGNRIMDYNTFYISGIGSFDFDIKGMGLIFSTAIGSTAFFQNNHGKILKDLRNGTIGVASIVAEKDKAFNEHITLDKKLKVRIDSERNSCSIYIDGETKVFKLKKGDEVIIERGPSVKLSFKNLDDFYKKRDNE